MPVNHDTSSQLSSLRVKEQLMLKLPTSRADRKKLEDLYQCVRQQVMCFALPGDREASEFITLVKADEQLGWLIDDALSTTSHSQLLCGSMRVGGAAHDPEQAGKAQATPTSFLLPATLTWPAQKGPIDWRDQYELSVIEARNALAGQLTQAAHDAVTPDATHTRDQMVHCSLWRVSMDAQALARIVTSGYVSAVPETAVEASRLVDEMKQEVETFRPQLLRILLQTYPKKPTAAAKPASAFPVAALGAQHASDSPWDAVRWRV
jgi:hypothetical protein